MAAYANKTPVPVERSRAEVERILKRWRVTRFGVQWDEKAAVIAFERDRWRVRFTVPVPPIGDFAITDGGVKRNPKQMEIAHAAEERRRWRSLVLVIKAKIEAVTSGVTSFEDEFLAHIIVGDCTVGEQLHSQLVGMRGGKAPQLLPKG